MQAVRRHARSLERFANKRDETLVPALPRRDIYADRRQFQAQVDASPVEKAGLLEDEGAERDNETGVLGDRDEVRRGNRPPVGIAPSHQRFAPGHPVAGDVDNRLEVQRQLPLLECPAQGALQLQCLGDMLVHVGGEETQLVPALGLGVVHGRIRLAQKKFVVIAIIRKDGDADAGGREHLDGAADDQRSGQFVEDPGGRHLHVEDAARVGQDDRELVTAEPGDGVVVVECGADAGCRRLDELVAGAVPETVVDVLEPVEVEEQQRDDVPVPLRARHGLDQPVAEEIAVGQAGQSVEVGLTNDKLFLAFALRDVVHGGMIGVDAVPPGEPDMNFHPDTRSVAGKRLDLVDLGSRGAGVARMLVGKHPFVLLRSEELQNVVFDHAAPVLDPVAEDLQQGIVDVEHFLVRMDDDALEGLVDQRAELGIGFLQVPKCLLQCRAEGIELADLAGPIGEIRSVAADAVGVAD